MVCLVCVYICVCVFILAHFSRYSNILLATDSPSHPRAKAGNVVFDQEFITLTEARNRQTRDALTGRLTSAQAHLNKEAIRTAYLALAEADVLRGDLTEAYHAALRAKDYCTNRAQTSQVSFLVLELAICLQNYPQARDFTFKVQHTLLPGGQTTGPSDVADKLLVTSALERLAHGDYAEAASKFRQVCHHVSTAAWQWDTLIATEDIATYAAITSMATASRSELMQWLDHPEALEFLSPPLVDAMFQLAARANYAGAWKILQQSQPLLELDLFLHPHLQPLFQKIRQTCILEYWIPYQRVQLPKMAHDLNFSSVPHLQKLIEELLLSGALQDCRMDCRTLTLLRDSSHNNTHHTSSAADTQRQLSKLGQQVLDDTFAMVVRLACIENDLIVIDPQQKDRPGHRGNNPSAGDEFEDDDSSDDGDTPMVDVAGVSPAIIGEDDDLILHAQNPEDLY
jgi:COP9 signalosome complex subunit 1